MSDHVFYGYISIDNSNKCPTKTFKFLAAWFDRVLFELNLKWRVILYVANDSKRLKKTDDQSLRQHIRVYTPSNTSAYYEGLNIILFSGKQKL